MTNCSFVEPLQFVEQPDEYQVTNYNVQPLLVIHVHCPVPSGNSHLYNILF